MYGSTVNFETESVDPPPPGTAGRGPPLKPVDETPHVPSAASMRSLLRRLRDLNVSARHIDAGPGGRISLHGCASGDGPAEAGVVYRLRDGQGESGRLVLSADGHQLVASVHCGLRRTSLCTELELDGEGRLSSSSLQLGVDLIGGDSQGLEQLLRRIVQRAFAQRTASPGRLPIDLPE